MPSLFYLSPCFLSADLCLNYGMAILLKRIPLTLAIIAMNLLLFILQALPGSSNPQSLLQWGANYWPLTTNGQYWRLITSIFLHAGVWHLITNMLGLLIIGYFLEPLLRPLRFGLVYLLTGIIAGIISIYFHPGMMGVGASGSIFGMYGVFLALLTTPFYCPSIRKAYLMFISLFVGLNLLAAMMITGIDNAAHLAGFLSGIAAGYVLYFSHGFRHLPHQ